LIKGVNGSKREAAPMPTSRDKF